MLKVPAGHGCCSYSRNEKKLYCSGSSSYVCSIFGIGCHSKEHVCTSLVGYLDPGRTQHINVMIIYQQSIRTQHTAGQIQNNEKHQITNIESQAQQT